MRVWGHALGCEPALVIHGRTSVLCKSVSCQGWESGITALDGKVDREVQRFLSALSLTLLPWVSVYIKFICWHVFRSPVAAGSTFSSKHKKVHFVGGLMLLLVYLQVTRALIVDRISSHLTCEKGHVLFGLGHSSFCMCMLNHFSCVRFFSTL